MYNNQFAVAIKAAGKVLREQKDKVFLPFGSEYSIYLKNLNTVRALVRIELDGVSVTGGTDLVVHPNGSIDLERFMKSGNLSQGNRFKFIERTAKVEAHRGVGAEDGLLRVEFQFEKPKLDNWIEDYKKKAEKEVHHHYHHYDYWNPWKYPYLGGGGCFGQSNYSLNAQDQLIGGCLNNATSKSFGEASSYAEPTFTSTTMSTAGDGGTIKMMASNASLPTGGGSSSSSSPMRGFAPAVNNLFASQEQYREVVNNDAGITVEGSISDQKFYKIDSFPVEDTKHVIILKLLGETESGKVAQPVTVKYKQTCKTCGTRNRGKLSQFCRDCGTSLEIV